MYNDMYQLIIEEPTDSFRTSFNAYPQDYVRYEYDEGERYYIWCDKYIWESDHVDIFINFENCYIRLVAIPGYNCREVRGIKEV